MFGKHKKVHPHYDSKKKKESCKYELPILNPISYASSTTSIGSPDVQFSPMLLNKSDRSNKNKSDRSIDKSERSLDESDNPIDKTDGSKRSLRNSVGAAKLNKSFVPSNQSLKANNPNNNPYVDLEKTLILNSPSIHLNLAGTRSNQSLANRKKSISIVNLAKIPQIHIDSPESPQSRSGSIDSCFITGRSHHHDEGRSDRSHPHDEDRLFSRSARSSLGSASQHSNLNTLHRRNGSESQSYPNLSTVVSDNESIYGHNPNALDVRSKPFTKGSFLNVIVGKRLVSF